MEMVGGQLPIREFPALAEAFSAKTERALQLFVPNWGFCEAVGGLKNMNGCMDREMRCKEVGAGKVTNQGSTGNLFQTS